MTETTAPKRKPGNSAFNQQRLSACQPIITPRTVFPVFIVIATIFAPLGGILFYFNAKALELSIDYTYCDTEAPFDFGLIPVKYVTDSMTKIKSLPENQRPKWKRLNITILPNNKTITQCSIRFYINKEMKPPVYLFYRLTNFFQNERGYARSLDTDQLKGKAVNRDSLKRGGCKSLALHDETIIYPCGLLANSIFNDTIGNLTLIDLISSPNESSQITNTTYNFTYNGIAPPGEAAKYRPTTYNINQIRPPLNWEARYPDGRYTNDYPPIDPSKDEHFQVWMHTAGLPIFRKTYGINETTPLQVGYYQININTVFPVKGFGGTKSIVISMPSMVGGKHPFPGIAYMVLGILCGIVGIIFAVESFYNSHKRRDRRYSSMQINDSQKDIDSQ